MNPSDTTAGHVGDQLPAPLHRDMLEDHLVNRQRAQARPDGQGGARHACLPRATCTRPQAHFALGRSCCTRSAGPAGISSC